VNQITDSESPERAYTFDDDGNMTQGYTPEGYVFDATYDAENRLIFLEYTDSGSILHRTEYTYGGDNLLYQIRKLEDGVETDLRRIIRAGFLPIQERDGNNNVVREYVWGIDMGGGIGGLLAIKESGADYYYLYDGKGNVTAITDASGTVVATYSYDPFGVLMEKTGTLDQPFRFSTKRYDEDTGLSYYGYRFYSASLGRWITRDPLGEAGGINLYGFVGNNAINGIDPLGLKNRAPVWRRPTPTMRSEVDHNRVESIQDAFETSYEYFQWFWNDTDSYKTCALYSCKTNKKDSTANVNEGAVCHDRDTYEIVEPPILIEPNSNTCTCIVWENHY
jgi:RHS repeat-associated protein